MKKKQLVDEDDPLRIDSNQNGFKVQDEICCQNLEEKEKHNINEKIPTELQEFEKNDYPQPSTDKAIIQKGVDSNRFGVTKIELFITLPIAILFLVYHFTTVAYKTQIIQKQTPMNGVRMSWFGYYRDDSDFQWKVIRENLLQYIALMSIFVLISSAIKSFYQDRPQEKFKYQIYFYSLTGFAYLIYTLRGGVVVWLFFSITNYGIQLVFYKQRFYPYILWTYSVWILYYINFYEYQPFQILSYEFPILGSYVYKSHVNAPIQWNWIYSLTLLRVMSFCLDKNWQYQNSYKFNLQQHQEKCLICSQGNACYKSRSESYLEPEYYNSIIYYFAYLTYLPLFITGPEMTFNAFISQVLQNQNTITRSKVKIYFVRALNNILVLELYTHLNFASALSKVQENQSYWINFSFCECLFMGYLNLIFIWLKCLTMWRLSRAFSLLDGLECPENMNRCIFNNYCFEGFWRSWHRGINLWMIRYLFIPLGGSRTKYWNIWIVFTFVAIWHDFELNTIIWAWFICAALVPEMKVKNWANKKSLLWQICGLRQNFFHKFKYLCAFTATLYIWLMVLANLIGFGQGWYNIKIVLEKLLQPDAFKQVLLVISSMYFLPITLFFIRDQEQYKGF